VHIFLLQKTVYKNLVNHICCS